MPPYDFANLGDHVGDDRATVAQNRETLARGLDLPAPEAWCWLTQVHGAAVVIAAGDPARSSEGPPPVADAAITAMSELPLVVLTADCAPVALASDDAVGVVHVGWRGLAAGVVESAVAALRSVGHGLIRAALGPCIHPAHYEFRAADLDELAVRLGPAVVGSTAAGRPAFDLPAGVRAALVAAGVDELHDVDVCTAADRSYFSHRRDGITGRQALVVVRT